MIVPCKCILSFENTAVSTLLTNHFCTRVLKTNRNYQTDKTNLVTALPRYLKVRLKVLSTKPNTKNSVHSPVGLEIPLSESCFASHFFAVGVFLKGRGEVFPRHRAPDICRCQGRPTPVCQATVPFAQRIAGRAGLERGLGCVRTLRNPLR